MMKLGIKAPFKELTEQLKKDLANLGVASLGVKWELAYGIINQLKDIINEDNNYKEEYYSLFKGLDKFLIQLQDKYKENKQYCDQLNAYGDKFRNELEHVILAKAIKTTKYVQVNYESYKDDIYMVAEKLLENHISISNIIQQGKIKKKDIWYIFKFRDVKNILKFYNIEKYLSFYKDQNKLMMDILSNPKKYDKEYIERNVSFIKTIIEDNGMRLFIEQRKGLLPEALSKIIFAVINKKTQASSFKLDPQNIDNHEKTISSKAIIKEVKEEVANAKEGEKVQLTNEGLLKDMLEVFFKDPIKAHNVIKNCINYRLAQENLDKLVLIKNIIENLNHNELIVLLRPEKENFANILIDIVPLLSKNLNLNKKEADVIINFMIQPLLSLDIVKEDSIIEDVISILTKVNSLKKDEYKDKNQKAGVINAIIKPAQDMFSRPKFLLLTEGFKKYIKENQQGLMSLVAQKPIQGFIEKTITPKGANGFISQLLKSLLLKEVTDSIIAIIPLILEMPLEEILKMINEEEFVKLDAEKNSIVFNTRIIALLFHNNEIRESILTLFLKENHIIDQLNTHLLQSDDSRKAIANVLFQLVSHYKDKNKFISSLMPYLGEGEDLKELLSLALKIFNETTKNKDLSALIEPFEKILKTINEEEFVKLDARERILTLFLKENHIIDQLNTHLLQSDDSRKAIANMLFQLVSHYKDKNKFISSLMPYLGEGEDLKGLLSLALKMFNETTKNKDLSALIEPLKIIWMVHKVREATKEIENDHTSLVSWLLSEDKFIEIMKDHNKRANIKELVASICDNVIDNHNKDIANILIKVLCIKKPEQANLFIGKEKLIQDTINLTASLIKKIIEHDQAVDHAIDIAEKINRLKDQNKDQKAHTINAIITDIKAILAIEGFKVFLEESLTEYVKENEGNIKQLIPYFIQNDKLGRNLKLRDKHLTAVTHLMQDYNQINKLVDLFSHYNNKQYFKLVSGFIALLPDKSSRQLLASVGVDLINFKINEQILNPILRRVNINNKVVNALNEAINGQDKDIGAVLYKKLAGPQNKGRVTQYILQNKDFKRLSINSSDNKEYKDKVFDGFNFNKSNINNYNFTNVTFKNTSFKGTKFINCTFEEIKADIKTLETLLPALDNAGISITSLKITIIGKYNSADLYNLQAKYQVLCSSARVNTRGSSWSRGL